MGAQSANELQWLDFKDRNWDSRPSNDPQDFIDKIQTTSWGYLICAIYPRVYSGGQDEIYDLSIVYPAMT